MESPTASLMYDGLSPELGVAILFTVPEVEIECDTLGMFKLNGSMLALFKPFNSETEQTLKQAKQS
jgi:hypothetical protein